MAKALVGVDRRRRIGPICPLIYGQFIEHLGRCIYGGIYEEGSPLSDERGFRKDVLAAAAELNPPVVRYPGGNFVSGYRWLDGVGPKSKRPRRWDRAWKTEESNRFGTDEFIQWCRQLKTEPYICVNLGDGTATEAAEWVEYCNAVSNTHFANLRRANGFEQPHAVKYWGLGNELYGDWQIGSKSAAAYSEIASDAARGMRRVEPDIKLIAIGNHEEPDWNPIVLRTLWDDIDYLAPHLYVGHKSLESHLAYGLRVEHVLRRTRAAIDLVSAERLSDRPIKIAFDEWNVWHSIGAGSLEKSYSLADALVVAQFLNAFIRHCDMVTMANMAQLVNILAPITTNPDGLFRQSIYWPLWIYRRAMLGHGLDVFCDCPTYRADVHFERHQAIQRDVPVIDVCGAIQPDDGGVALAVVNRSMDEKTELTIDGIDLVGSGKAWVLTGPDADAANDFACPDNVAAQEVNVADLAAGQVVKLEPLCLTVLPT